ncbi:MAG: ABC transporter substrate-binding protein [Candidatus Anammoxibacter sp.]
MKRIILLIICFFLLCAAGGKIVLAKLIIVTSNGNVFSYNMAAEGFMSVVGETVTEYDMELDPSKGRKIIKKIKKLVKSENPPSAILAIGHFAAKRVTRKIKDIPVIFCMVINPEDSDLTLGKNVGGVSFDISPEHQLSRLKKLIPEARNVGVIYNPENSGTIIKKAKVAAKSLGLKIIDRKVRSLKEISGVLPKLIKEVDSLWIIPDNTVLTRESFKFISLKALRDCVPIMACSPQLVEMGSPFSIFAEPYSVGRQAGILCKKVLNGEITGQIPIEVPCEIFMAINLVTMKRCGIEPPQNILDSAKLIYK